MRIRIAPKEVVLEDPDVFSRFDVECAPALTEDDVRAALRRHRLGYPLGPDHVMVYVAGLRKLAPGPATPEWDAGFRGMLTYAERMGWMDHDRTHVRCHIVRT